MDSLRGDKTKIVDMLFAPACHNIWSDFNTWFRCHLISMRDIHVNLIHSLRTLWNRDMESRLPILMRDQGPADTYDLLLNFIHIDFHAIERRLIIIYSSIPIRVNPCLRGT